MTGLTKGFVLTHGLQHIAFDYDTSHTTHTGKIPQEKDYLTTIKSNFEMNTDNSYRRFFFLFLPKQISCTKCLNDQLQLFLRRRQHE